MNTGDSAYNNYNSAKGRQAFATASLVMGIISMVLLCTGVLSIPTGALGILFSSLAKKPGEDRTSQSKYGLIFSVIGLVLGILIISVALYWFYTDPSALEQVRDMYEAYGMEMPDFPNLSGGSR